MIHKRQDDEFINDYNDLFNLKKRNHPFLEREISDRQNPHKLLLEKQNKAILNSGKKHLPKMKVNDLTRHIQEGQRNRLNNFQEHKKNSLNSTIQVVPIQSESNYRSLAPIKQRKPNILGFEISNASVQNSRIIDESPNFFLRNKKNSRERNFELANNTSALHCLIPSETQPIGFTIFTDLKKEYYSYLERISPAFTKNNILSVPAYIRLKLTTIFKNSLYPIISKNSLDRRDVSDIQLDCKAMEFLLDQGVSTLKDNTEIIELFQSLKVSLLRVKENIVR